MGGVVIGVGGQVVGLHQVEPVLEDGLLYGEGAAHLEPVEDVEAGPQQRPGAHRERGKQVKETMFANVQHEAWGAQRERETGEGNYVC